MMPTPWAINRGLGTLIVVACLAGVVGCGDYQVDLGPTLDDQSICSSVANDAQASLTFVHGDGAGQGTLPVTGAQVAFSQVALHGQLPNFLDGSLTVRAWASGAGTYRCEDPSSAGRTRIFGLASHSTDINSPLVYDWTVDTLSGGACSISITHFPGADGPSLEGTFTASGGGSSSFSGRFFVSNPCN